MRDVGRRARTIGLMVLGLLASAGCGTTAPPADTAPAGNAMDWTLGSWHGVRRSGDGSREDPMTVRVEPLPHGTGQVECLRVETDPQPYIGFTVRSHDAASGEWMMVYANGTRKRFAHLRGRVEDRQSTWTSITPGRARESRMVSERPGPDRWRKTQYASEDGGATWRVLFVDDLERTQGG